jgi:hypothetical protein
MPVIGSATGTDATQSGVRLPAAALDLSPSEARQDDGEHEEEGRAGDLPKIAIPQEWHGVTHGLHGREDRIALLIEPHQDGEQDAGERSAGDQA